MRTAKAIAAGLTLLCLALCARAEEAPCAHEWTYQIANAQTHTAVCAKCAETQTAAHALTASRAEATCLLPAQDTYTCAICGYGATYAQGEPAQTHEWGAYIQTRAATCAREGEETRACAVCQKTQTRALDKTEHIYGGWSPYDEKWHIKYCKNCGWAYKGSHRLGEGKITVPATQTSLGAIETACRVCGQTFARAVNLEGAVFSTQGEDILGNGVEYVMAEAMALPADTAREIPLPGGALQVLARDNCEIAVYANPQTGVYAGLYVYAGQAEVVLVPEDAQKPLFMEFIRVSEGASLALRIWNAAGEAAIYDAGGAAVSVFQCAGEDGGIVTAITRTETAKGVLTGDGALYACEDGALRFTSAGVSPEEGARGLYAARWQYDAKTRKLTAGCSDALGKCEGVAYYALVDDIIAMGARDTKTAEGILKTEKNSRWRLKIAFPGGDAYQSPVYAPDGGLVTLADAGAYLTREARAADNADSAKAAAPAESAESAESARPRVYAGGTAIYQSGESPRVEGRFENLTYAVNVTGLPEGWKILEIRLIQAASGGAPGLRIQNAYASHAAFALDNQNSRFSAQITAENAEGQLLEIPAGDFDLFTNDAAPEADDETAGAARLTDGARENP